MSEAAQEDDPAPHETSPHGGVEQLVRMANDIGNFFRAEAHREDAILGIGNHISHYWTRRMRDKLAAHLRSGGADLDELPREALQRLTGGL